MSNERQFDQTSFLRSLTHRPGVYRMLDAKHKVIYVGKARDLRKRVSSYFQRSHDSVKTAAMMELVANVEVTVTNTEAEALILEYNLIKQHRPRFNVILRDDKSYPYIYVSTQQEFPRLQFHRGARKGKGRYFGPYPSAGAVRETLQMLQKLFPVRQCEDSYFRNRSRPCLQYQIDRCTAPCVGFVTPEHYQQDVRDTELFLEGKASDVVERWVEKMETASTRLEFEEAARIREEAMNLLAEAEKEKAEARREAAALVAGSNR